MAKRGYKLQEFLAHSANVNCLSIGKKTSRLLITGGDDCNVNLWAIGKPTSLMSLCGHTSPVDSVDFDPSEVSVLAGASSGVIKLWNLEEAKMVRALTGHRSNCSAVEFHPFGEFFASGSMDTNLRIWDIRKKGCIHTYKGHTRGINTIKFTPDGRWVVSGGLDNVVKVWDLTAGKLLHDFKFHEGHIRSLDFHPLEFLLATGSADRTVKFWDLETFELIGSSRPEATGVRSIAFHPDGRTLFCGLDDGLKVYSWEPVVCHDGVDMGWSTLGDFCINEGKLLGCSYYQNSVGIWVADISLIEPYGAGAVDKKEYVEKIFSTVDNQSSGVKGSGTRRSTSPDYETKEIKNIYIDSTGGNSTAAEKPGPLSTPKVVLPMESGKLGNMTGEKQSTGQAGDKSFVVPSSVVPRDSDIGKEGSDSGRESITFSRTRPGMLLRPAHVRKTAMKFDEKRQSVAVQSGNHKKCGSDTEKEADTQSVSDSEEGKKKSNDAEESTIKSIAVKFEKALSPESPANEVNRMLLKPPHVQRSPNPKYNEARRTLSVDSGSLGNTNGGLENSRGIDLKASYVTEGSGRNPSKEDINNKSIATKSERVLSPEKPDNELKSRESPGGNSESNSVKIVRGVRVFSGRTRSLVERFEKREKSTPSEDKAASTTSDQNSNMVKEEPNTTKSQAVSPSPTIVMPVVLDRATNMTSDEPPMISTRRARSTPARVIPVVLNQETNMTSDEPNITSTRSARASPVCVLPVRANQASKLTSDTSHIASKKRASATQTLEVPTLLDPVADVTSDRPANDISNQKEEPQGSGRQNDSDIIEDLMQTHDTFLTTLQSRLTKLQIVRHFWERNDVKGAIGALRKLSDHSVQADVISILSDKTEILKLDLFSQLLPVLSGLLGSRTERSVNVSLEMLLKLVAVFGPVIRSTVSAPRIVGVDLHAEQRLEICRSCFEELQKVQKILPVLSRRGGLISRKAQELNLVLQEP
ncbi:PREDICTED: katanin p80 WD40 repeat-containing subunit B1 homolog isoform X2 [Tarenaya hassleriana]|uniref:katanin p80 WD40 repeat-containing subunit B1 homolog isoform X2 n=1 Tax=Tarenaya hassleriana TaxID=28532 RepID=UPI00053C996C|nr:PREDICTED: katanin p80 WD40 repeat-containing subunit B1 homolog isoform X2 [Tarenaya hassleriana]